MTIWFVSQVCIDPEKVLEVGERSEKRLKSKLKLNVSIEGGSEDDESDGEEEELRMNAERQRKLIQEAFAGDDVVEDFIKEQKVSKSSEVFD